MADRLASLQLLDIEVAHAEKSDEALGLERRQGCPRLLQRRACLIVRPVDLIEVDIVHLEAAQAIRQLFAYRGGPQVAVGRPGLSGTRPHFVATITEARSRPCSAWPTTSSE